MKNYIELNKKNTQLLLDRTDVKVINSLKRRRYTEQTNMLKNYMTKESSILDIGVRDGAFLEWLKSLGYKNLYGIDIYEKTVDIVNEKGIPCKLADAQEMSLGKKFDVIVMSHVLEHCPDTIKVLNNVFGHLNKDGVVFIEVPIEQGDPKPTEKDAHYANFSSFDSLMFFFDERWQLLKSNVTSNRIKIIIGALT